MSYGHTQQARGFQTGDGRVKIAVAMPREHFEHMRLKALKSGCSISQVIRDYIDIGIIVDKDMELDEPQPAICTVDISLAPGLQKVLSESGPGGVR